MRPPAARGSPTRGSTQTYNESLEDCTAALVVRMFSGQQGAVMLRKQVRGDERMAVVDVYASDDRGFKRWLRENPNGYVLNCYKTGKVHSASCKSYQSAGPRMTYTRAEACSTSEQQLYKYAAQHGIDAIHCARC